MLGEQPCRKRHSGPGKQGDRRGDEPDRTARELASPPLADTDGSTRLGDPCVLVGVARALDAALALQSMPNLTSSLPHGRGIESGLFQLAVELLVAEVENTVDLFLEIVI
jgi:hypothetical protein